MNYFLYFKRTSFELSKQSFVSIFHTLFTLLTAYSNSISVYLCCLGPLNNKHRPTIDMEPLLP